MKRGPDFGTVKLAVANSTTSAALVGTAVDAAGYGRAKFIFTFGTPLTTAGSIVKGSSVGIWCAAGSASSVAGAGTYASVPSAFLAAGTTGVLSNAVAVLDIAIPAGSHWLIVSGSLDSTNVPLNATVELYETVVRPPTHAAPVPVIVG